MQTLIRQIGKARAQQQSSKADLEKRVDLEMEECLAKLKVWETENLMAPRGMDRFVSGSNAAGERR